MTERKDDRKYREAFNKAADLANRTRMDVGLEKDYFGAWSVFLLPRPENRVGHELRCQVVTPNTPRMTDEGGA